MRYCYHCFINGNGKVWMVKKRAIEIEQIVWQCNTCGHMEIIVEYVKHKQDKNGNRIDIDPYPKSVWEKYQCIELPIIMDNRKKEFPPERKNRNLFTEDNFLNEAYVDKFKM